MVWRAESRCEALDVGPEALTASVALGALDEVDGTVKLGGEQGRCASAEHEAARCAADPLAHDGARGDKGPRTAEGFSEGGDQRGGLDLVGAGVAGHPSLVGEEAKAVGLVEVQTAIGGEVGAHCGRVGVVTVH